MTDALRRHGTTGAALLLLALALPAASRAQENTHPELDRQLARVDLGVSAAGVFSSNSSGSNYLFQNVTLQPSNTVGVLVTLRYTKSARIGVEFNYARARYSNDFAIAPTPKSPTGSVGFGVSAQANASEYTIGYIAHPGTLFGLQPFVGGGGGAIIFRPTRSSDLGVINQARGTFFYTAGLERLVYGEHFGLRVAFRQLFYGAPDFEANYLAIGKHAIISEPTIGFFLRF